MEQKQKEKRMNAEKSRKKATEFLKSGKKLKRKTQKAKKIFSFPTGKIFPQLCPTRELDWIEGWACDLVYTSTGYIEADCIWTTPETNVFGPGLWITTRYEPDRELWAVHVIETSVVEHVRISLIQNEDGSTTGLWDLTFTALDESGNAIVESIPDDDPTLERALERLEYLLKTEEGR